MPDENSENRVEYLPPVDFREDQKKVFSIAPEQSPQENTGETDETIETLKKQINELGYEIPEVAKGFGLVDRYLDREIYPIDIVLDGIRQILPEEIESNTRPSTQERERNRKIFEKINVLLEQEHELRYIELCQALKMNETNPIDPQEYKTRAAFMSKVRKLTQSREILPDSLRTAIANFYNNSWKMAVANYRMALGESEKARKRIGRYGIEITQEDAFQQGMLAAFSLACDSDPKKGPYITFISKYLYPETQRTLLEDSDIKEQDISQRLQLRREALKITRGTIYEDDHVAQDHLTALLYYKKTGSIDFADDEIFPALAEIMDFHRRVEKIKANEDSITEKQLAERLRGIKFEHFSTTMRPEYIATGLEIFFKKQQYFEGMQDPISLDQEWPLHIDDEELLPGHTASISEGLKGDQQEERPTEEPLERKELEKALYKILGELSPREREVITLRFGLGDGKEHTYREIGAELGVSYQRIQDILEKAFLRLQHPDRTRVLQSLR